MIANPDLYIALIIFSVIGVVMVVTSIAFIIKKWMESKTSIEKEETPEIPMKPGKQEKLEKLDKTEQLGDEAKEEITTAIEQEQKEGSEDKEKMTEIPNTFGVDKIPCIGCKVTLRIPTIKRPVAIECPKCRARMKLS